MTYSSLGTGALRNLAVIVLVACSGLPEADQPNRFRCRSNDDCIEGFVCSVGFCGRSGSSVDGGQTTEGGEDAGLRDSSDDSGLPLLDGGSQADAEITDAGIGLQPPPDCDPIQVINSSFEDPILADNFFTFPSNCDVDQTNAIASSDPVPGWDTASDSLSGVVNPTLSQLQVSSGANVAYLNSPAGNCLSQPEISQTLTATVEAGYDYWLLVDIGYPSFFPIARGYRIILESDGGVIALDIDSAVTAIGSQATATASGRVNAGDPRVGEFLRVRLSVPDLPDPAQTDFDNVRLCKSAY